MIRSMLAGPFLIGLIASAGSSRAEVPEPALMTLAAEADTTSMRNSTATMRAVSDDGRYVLLETSAVNLASGVTDRNLSTDVYLFDKMTQASQLVSRRLNQANTTASGPAFASDMTPDGRWIVYRSTAHDVVPGVIDYLGQTDVFLFDRTTGESTLVSHRIAVPNESGDGASYPAGISPDGRYVLFESDAYNIAEEDFNHARDLFLFDRDTNAVTLISRRSASLIATAAGATSLGQMSADGTYVAFVSTAANIAAGVSDTNAAADVFLWNRITNASTLVSHLAGNPLVTANGESSQVRLALGGGFIAFSTTATNIATGITDSNGASDVYRWTRSDDAVALVSASASNSALTASGSSEVADISDDGNWVTMRSNATNMVGGQSDSNSDFDLFVRDQGAGVTQLVSRALDQVSQTPSQTSTLADVTSDGRYFLFHSTAPNIGSGIIDMNISGPDTFLFDRVNQVTHLVSHRASSTSSTPGDNPSSFSGSVSSDGRYVAFQSDSAELVANTADRNHRPDVFLKDFQSGLMTLVSRTASSVPTSPESASSGVADLSSDGRWLLYVSGAPNIVGTTDSSTGFDAFLVDRDTLSTRLVSGVNGSSSVTNNSVNSAYLSRQDGRYVAYDTSSSEVVSGVSDSNFLFDVFLFDRLTNETTLVSHAAIQANQTANSGSNVCAISGNGRFVLFQSGASNLVSGVSDINGLQDVFLYDRLTGTNTLVSRATSGSQTPNGVSHGLAISADGRWVVFKSTAIDLINGITDSNSAPDLFLFDSQTGVTTLISRAASGVATGQGTPTFGSMSEDGNLIAFSSTGGDLIAGMNDTNAASDVFLYRHSNQTMKLVSHTAAAELTTGNELSVFPTISADGSYVGYSSRSTNLVSGSLDFNGVEDAFLYEVATGTNKILSLGQVDTNTAANGASYVYALSGDANFVAITTSAPNIAQYSDNNLTDDVIVYARQSGVRKLMSRRATGGVDAVAGQGRSFAVEFDHDGSTLVMLSSSADLSSTVNDGNGAFDFFVARDAPLISRDGFE